MAAKIAKPERSLLDETTEEDREQFMAIAEVVRAAGNWKGRKRRFLDVLVGLDQAIAEADPAAAAMPPEDVAALRARVVQVDEEERRALAEAGEDPGEPVDVDELVEAMGELDFIALMPSYVGSLLEALDEDRIVCVEQAAFYHLSAHPEHQDAAEAWFAEDHRNETAFRKFLRANRDYADLLDRFEAMLDEEEDDLDLDEDQVIDGAGGDTVPANDDEPGRR